MLFESPLESERFKIRAGKLKICNSNEASLALNQAAEGKYDFLSCRLSIDELGLVQTLENQGFFLTDTIVYYRKSINQDASYDQSWQSCLSRKEAGREIERVTRETFKDYPSHYSADKRFHKYDLTDVYADWAKRSFTDRSIANDILGAVIDGELRAFVTIKDHEDLAEILLAAVHPAYQGQGLLQGLLSSAVAWAKTQGHQEILYSTQIQNIGAQKALVRQGWEPHKYYHTLHKWLD